MSTKLKRANPKDKIDEKLFEEKFENIKLLFTISFILSDSIMVFDLVCNIVLSRPLEEYFYMRFFVAFFGLYGTLIIIAGNICREYWDCEFSCCCGKFCENIYSLCGCHVFFGGLFLTASYCFELCSIKIYFDNKDKFEEEFIGARFPRRKSDNPRSARCRCSQRTPAVRRRRRSAGHNR